ncbi:MAG TPA: hypothetical protein VFK17_06390 [Gaiellaceae bacterium]|nr:hypothetical protein [Gaiellaceae bacterium]
MARKPDAAKAKAAKQKKMLIVLSGVLLLALVYAFMTVRGLNKGGASAAPPPAATTTTTTTTTTPTTPAATPAPGTSAAPALGTAASSVASASSTDAAAVPLVAATKPAAGTGQLESFSRFASKDPFDADGPKSAGASSSGGGSSSAPASSSGGGGAPTDGGSVIGSTPKSGGTAAPAAPAAQQQPPPSSAVIAVNGVSALVATGADFPASPDPVENGIFHLLSLTQTTAQVTVVGGSYSSGSPTLTLKVNQPVTLVNTADGKRYTLQLFPQGTAPPAGASAAATSTTTP